MAKNKPTEVKKNTTVPGKNAVTAPAGPAPVVAPPVAPEAPAKETGKQSSGNIECGRCHNVYPASRAIEVPQFGRKGCPKCGFPIPR